MTRMTRLSAVLALTLGMVGCVYHPGGYDHRTGLMYGGALRPMCGGPLDPFCAFCDDCQPSCFTDCCCLSGPCLSCNEVGMCPAPTPTVMPAAPGYPVTSWPAPSCPTCQPSAMMPVYSQPQMTYASPQYEMPSVAPSVPTPYPTHDQPQSQPVSEPQPMSVPGPIGTPPPAPPADMTSGMMFPADAQYQQYQMSQTPEQPGPVYQASGEFYPPIVR